MQNIDNPVFSNLDESVLNNVIFRSFINDLQPSKIEDSSFINLIYSLDSSTLTSSSFTSALSLLHGRDDDIITNGEFADAISVMRAEFLTSSDFFDFISSFNSEAELSTLESRDNFSFLGKLEAGYFEISSRLSSEVLENETFDAFINTVDVGALTDQGFVDFIVSLESETLTDASFIDSISSLDESALTNGLFTDDLLRIDESVLRSDVFYIFMGNRNSSELSARGDSYIPLSDYPDYEILSSGTGGATSDRVFIEGTRDDEIISGNDEVSVDEEINGYGGDDLIAAFGGFDLIYGGSGRDTLFGGEDGDILYGQRNDDELSGQAGEDDLFGGSGDDLLDGGTGSDTLTGGTGSDTLIGGLGDDLLYVLDPSIVLFSSTIDYLTGGTGSADTFSVEAQNTDPGRRFNGRQKAVITDFDPIFDGDTITLPGPSDAYRARYDARTDTTVIQYVEDDKLDLSFFGRIPLSTGISIDSADADILYLQDYRIESDLENASGFSFTTS